MKVLILGGLGSIGSRYASILKYIGHEPIIADVKDGLDETLESYRPFEKAIIATPTETHYWWCKHLTAYDIPFLCEKPLSKDLEQCEYLARLDTGSCYVVNNYEFLIKKFFNKKPSLIYNYFRTGNDGIEWDCCQLINIDPNVVIRTKSPIWTLYVDGMKVDYELLEESYIQMVQAFLDDKKELLWSLKDGLNMTNKVLERIAK